MANLKNKIFSKLKIIPLVLIILVLVNAKVLLADMFSFSIDIVAEGQNIKKAQELALDKGRVEALKKSVEKIVSKAYNSKLNNIITIDNAKNFEKSFSLSDENITSKKYEAKAYFTFNDKEIYTFLTDNNIPFVKTTVKDYSSLIIPVFLDYNSKIESTSGNIWSDFWIDENNRNNFISTFIYYNPPNMQFLSNKEYIKSIKKNLNVNEIYLIYLQENMDQTYNLIVTNYSDFSTTTYTNISFVDAVSFAAQDMEEQVKDSTFTVYARNKIIDSFIINTVTLQDWIKIEKILDSKPDFIINYTIYEINSDNIKIKVTHKNNIKELKQKFDAICIALDENTMSLQYSSNC